MPKGGGSKTPQLDHFPLNTDMVEKQGGKKVRLINKHTHSMPNNQIFIYSKINYCLSLKPDFKPLHVINNSLLKDSKGT